MSSHKMVAFNTVARGQFCCFVLLACCITASNVASNAPPPFTQFLEENNVPNAVSTALTQYKVEAGPERGANVSALTDIINTAAVAFGDLDQAKQPVYAKAFGEFIHQLDPTLSANQSTLLEAFENSIASALTARYCVTASCLRYDYTGPLVELTHAAALDQSYVGAFEQAKESQQSVEEAKAVLDNLQTHGGASPRNYTIDASLLASLQAAAENAFAASPKTLNQAKGNTTAIASLIFGSAHLAEGNIPAAAHNLSATVTSAGLPVPVQQQAFQKAILYTLQIGGPGALGHGYPSTSINTTTVLIAAAVAAQQSGAISASFAEADTVPLQVFCAVALSAAKNVSSAAEQAVLSAIPQSFGSQPCSVFQGLFLPKTLRAQAEELPHMLTALPPDAVSLHAGHEDFLYRETLSAILCDTFSTLSPAQDCQQAIAMLKGNSSQCLVLENNPGSFASENQQTSLASKGNCAVVIGGSIGSGLPCSKVVEYAEQIATACATSRQFTAGSYFYPEGKTVPGIHYLLVRPPSL